MNTNTIIGVSVGAILIFIIGLMVVLQQGQSSLAENAIDLDAFTTCVDESGATFYGAYWCSHCNAQKKDFGASVELLPYVECSTPDGKGQTAVCAEEGITGYPTWRFGDGTEERGRLSLATIAQITGCELPQEEEV